MAKIKFDVSKSDPSEAKGGNYVPIPTGPHKAKLAALTQTWKKGEDGNFDKTSPMIKIEVSFPKFPGRKVYDYINFTEASQWKMDQFLQAFGVATAKKRKGTFDTDDLVGELFVARITHETDEYQGETRIRERLRTYIALEDGDLDDEEDEAEDDEEEFEEEEAEEEEDDVEDEDEEDSAAVLDEDDADEEADDEPDELGYDHWEVKDLRSELKARELPIGGKKSDMVARLEQDDIDAES